MDMFKQLKFSPNSGSPGTRAYRGFSNGYSVSVLTGRPAQTDEEHPYSVAVIEISNLASASHLIGSDRFVMAFQTAMDVDGIMKQVAALPDADGAVLRRPARYVDRNQMRSF